ncbi:phage tail protein [Bacillus subtilis]|nr:phage tail protein [Pseudomonas sp. A29(2023)]MDL5599348.1 phage tail protein [Bacillus subtilis]
MVDQNSIFGGMLTTLGANKKTNCDALGIPWEPRYMLIGDANGTDPVPDPAQTKLINQVYRAQLNQLRVSPTDSNVLIAELVLPPDVGGWWIRELALEDKDGVFSAVANVAPSYKPLLAQGSGRNQVVRMHIITNGTSNIQLKIDPAVVLATRAYVDDKFTGLLPADKVAGTYTKVTVNDRGVFVSGSNPTTLAGFGIKDTYTKTEIESMIAQASALPVGVMAPLPVDKIPPGFLELDGSVKSVSVYPDLAAFLGTVFNKGDEGAGNFRLPESRGEFLRCWDHGRGIDPGRALGSWQKGSGHSFDQGVSAGVVGDRTPSTDAVVGRADLGYDPAALSDYPVAQNMSASGVGASITGAGEISFGSTRPRNLAVMWCIKAWNAPINQGNIDIQALAALATQATEVKLGTAKIATQELTDAGTNDTTIVTPAKLKFGFSATFATTGWIRLPSWLGGLTLSWQQVTASSAGLTVSLPIAVANKFLGTWAQHLGPKGGPVYATSMSFDDAAKNTVNVTSSVSGAAAFTVFVLSN